MNCKYKVIVEKYSFNNYRQIKQKIFEINYFNLIIKAFLF